jgi:hypothetical protein
MEIAHSIYSMQAAAHADGAAELRAAALQCTQTTRIMCQG